MNPLLIDHIGIVVRDISSSLVFYRDILGLPLEGIENNKDYNVDIAFLRCGETLVELLQPTGEGSLMTYLETKGEGVHHLAIRVGSIVEALESLKAGNTPLVDDRPKRGGGGAKIAFLEAVAANNVSIELIER